MEMRLGRRRKQGGIAVLALAVAIALNGQALPAEASTAAAPAGQQADGQGFVTTAEQAVTNYTQKTYIGYDPQTGKDRAPEYYHYANEGAYTIAGLEGYQLYTIEDGTAFHATHCFDEANGQYWDLDLPYALYVPADYNPQKSYGLVLHIHDAGSMSSDPRLTLTESQAAANYASEAFQSLVKANGLAGVIVLCPAIAEFYPMDAAHLDYELRMARDNWTLSCAEPAIWQLMDKITKEYHIDPDRIYGSGQSMGGMTVMAMAAQQKKTADHIYSVDRKDPSKVVYYPTGRRGAGTQGYNSGVTALGSTASLPPGWQPSSTAKTESKGNTDAVQ